MQTTGNIFWKQAISNDTITTKEQNKDKLTEAQHFPKYYQLFLCSTNIPKGHETLFCTVNPTTPMQLNWNATDTESLCNHFPRETVDPAPPYCPNENKSATDGNPQIKPHGS